MLSDWGLSNQDTGSFPDDDEAHAPRRTGGLGEMKTPYDEITDALNEALGFLGKVPEADELCDRIVGLINPPECQWNGCTATGDGLVYDRKGDRFMRCCMKHRNRAADQDNPEYIHECENCGCTIPIN